MACLRVAAVFMLYSKLFCLPFAQLLIVELYMPLGDGLFLQGIKLDESNTLKIIELPTQALWISCSPFLDKLKCESSVPLVGKIPWDT